MGGRTDRKRAARLDIVKRARTVSLFVAASGVALNASIGCSDDEHGNTPDGGRSDASTVDAHIGAGGAAAGGHTSNAGGAGRDTGGAGSGGTPSNGGTHAGGAGEGGTPSSGGTDAGHVGEGGTPPSGGTDAGRAGEGGVPVRDAASDVSIGTGGADGGLPDSSTPLDSATIHSDPFRWTKSGAFSQLPSSAPEELTGGAGAATGMSADGSTIFGYYVSTTGSTSVRRWVGGAVPELLGSGKTLPMSVSADGRTAVINQQDVWRESAASLTIQDPTAFKLVPQLVSADGSTVVGYWQATAVAPLGTFIWDAVRGVRHLPCTMCTPTTVSAHGKVIGGSFYNGKTGDFVWDEKHGMRELQDLLVGSGVTLPAGATIVTLISMSHDARVFAGAVSLPSDLQAYKATLPADAFD